MGTNFQTFCLMSHLNDELFARVVTAFISLRIVEKVGSSTYATKCKCKHFKKTCNQPMMREIKSSNGTTKFCPHNIYCFVSLIASLQALVMRSGFVEQCESTRNLFSMSVFSDIYDGSLWQDFLTVNNTPFLSEFYSYGLLLNIDWLQPYKHIEYSVGILYIVILNLPRSIRYKREM